MKMDKRLGVIVLILALIVFFNVDKKEAITGSETMDRTLATSGRIEPSSTFTIAYQVSGASGAWGASIEDLVSGGCTFPSGSATYKSVMLSEDGTSKSITMNAPAYDTTCIFVGDYKFGDFSIQNLNPISVTVEACVPVCTRPADLCIASTSNGCGGTCPWTVTKLTSVDDNCDNSISRAELGTAINSWVSGSFSRTDLGIAITSWAGG